jgi:hypothetical protein
MVSENYEVFRPRVPFRRHGTPSRTRHNFKVGDLVRRQHPRTGEARLEGTILKIRRKDPRPITVRWNDGAQSHFSRKALELV